MSLLIASRYAQRPLVAEFIFNFNDTIKDVNGAVKNFGSSDLALVADIINLPPNAVVIGGDVTVETAFDAATYTLKLGDSASDARYLAASDVKATGRTPLTPSGFRNTDSLNLRMTLAIADVCTTGKASVRVHYIISGRADETIPS